MIWWNWKKKKLEIKKKKMVKRWSRWSRIFQFYSNFTHLHENDQSLNGSIECLIDQGKKKKSFKFDDLKIKQMNQDVKWKWIEITKNNTRMNFENWQNCFHIWTTKEKKKITKLTQLLIFFLFTFISVLIFFFFSLMSLFRIVSF